MTAPTLPIHPSCQIFPMMSQSELAELAEDIRTNGLRNPIVMLGDQILDGRNRLAACRLAGAAPSFIQWDGEGDPTSWVLSQNLHRRHLTASQRSVVAAKLATMRQGRPSTENRQERRISQSQAAELLGVGERSVRSAAAVLQQGVPELVEAVEDGEIAVSPAARVARLPKTKQRAAVHGARRRRCKARTRSPGCDERHAPMEYVELARAVMGSIDCDPASSGAANRRVRATTYYTSESSGLTHEWGERVWLCPPRGKAVITQFCAELVRQLEAGIVGQACVLVDNATESDWCQKLLDGCTAACFVQGTVPFSRTDGKAEAPASRGQILLYFGGSETAERFVELAADLGVVLR